MINNQEAKECTKEDYDPDFAKELDEVNQEWDK